MSPARAAGEPAMPTGFCANIVTAKLGESWDFYTELLGFRTVDENGSQVLLEHPCGARLGLLEEETHEEHPELVCATDGRGFWFGFEVADVDREYRRCMEAGARALCPPANDRRGVRSFMLRDPNGVLVCVAGPTAGLCAV